MGQALPLISLQYHEVRLNIKLAAPKELIRAVSDDGSAVDPTLTTVDSTTYTKSAVEDFLASSLPLHNGASLKQFVALIGSVLVLIQSNGGFDVM